MQTIADATAFKTKLSRPVAVLACGHCFHLDCIGNSFNAKRAMECPCCRDTQEGEWHTPKTPRHNSNSAENDNENSQPVDLFVSIQRAVLFRELLNLRRSNINDMNHLSFVARRLIPSRNNSSNNGNATDENNTDEERQVVTDSSGSNNNHTRNNSSSSRRRRRRRVALPQTHAASSVVAAAASLIPLTPRRRRPRRTRSLSVDTGRSSSDGGNGNENNATINHNDRHYHRRNSRRRFHRSRAASLNEVVDGSNNGRNSAGERASLSQLSSTENENNMNNSSNSNNTSRNSNNTASTTRQRRHPTRITTDFEDDSVHSIIDLPSTPVIKRVVSLARAEMRLLQVEILQREQELRVATSISNNSNNTNVNNHVSIFSSPNNAASVSRKIESDILRRREFLSQALGTFRCSAIMMENAGQVSQEEVDATTLFLKRHIVSAQKELRGLHQSEASREAALLRRIGVLREMETYLEDFPRQSISPLAPGNFRGSENVYHSII